MHVEVLAQLKFNHHHGDLGATVKFDKSRTNKGLTQATSLKSTKKNFNLKLRPQNKGKVATRYVVQTIILLSLNVFSMNKWKQLIKIDQPIAGTLLKYIYT